MSATEIFVGLIGWVAGVVSIVVGEWLNNYLKRLKMNVVVAPQIISNIATKHREILGFGINIEQGKELEEAYARFNNTIYPWHENGKLKAKTELFVGEEPSWIFPYLLSLDYIEDATKYANIPIIKKGEPSNHGVLLSISEIEPTKGAIKNKIYEKMVIMPKDAEEVNISINQKLSQICIRLIAKGIERKMKYSGEIKIKGLSIGKIDNGVPDLTTGFVNLIVYHD